jgi:single-strand DNA-binding protein
MYQSLTIVGNLTADPEMRYTPSGTPVTSLNVATNRTYVGSDGEKVKEVVYFRVSVFGKVAESTSEYLKKGDPVLVEGRLTPEKSTGGPRTYQKKDGSFGATYEVFANTVRFLPKKDGGKREKSSEQEDDAF